MLAHPEPDPYPLPEEVYDDYEYEEEPVDYGELPEFVQPNPQTLTAEEGGKVTIPCQLNVESCKYEGVFLVCILKRFALSPSLLSKGSSWTYLYFKGVFFKVLVIHWHDFWLIMQRNSPENTVSCHVRGESGRCF